MPEEERPDFEGIFDPTPPQVPYRPPSRFRTLIQMPFSLIVAIFRKPLVLIMVIAAILIMFLAISGSWTSRSEQGTWKGMKVRVINRR